MKEWWKDGVRSFAMICCYAMLVIAYKIEEKKRSGEVGWVDEVDSWLGSDESS